MMASHSHQYLVSQITRRFRLETSNFEGCTICVCTHVYVFSVHGWRKSCQWLVSSAGGTSIRQGLSSFPTVHWPWVPGIDFLWCRTERGRYHMAPAVGCDQEQIPEIPMRWWWIAGLWRPSILTYRNQGDTCTEFIIIQNTDVAEAGMQT